MVEYLHEGALLPDNIRGYKEGGEGKLSAALHAPVDGFGTDDIYPTRFEKLAALGYRICHDHAFEDANKRTAMLTMVFTLEANGFVVDWSEKTAVIVGSLLGAHLIDQAGLRHALILACGLDPLGAVP